MRTLKIFKISLFAFTVLSSCSLFAQAPEKPLSPADSAVGNIGNATVKIRYSSPSVKGRTIWGGLVPYDKVWRAGANEATTIEFSKDVIVEGKPLKAGKYGFFAIPHAGNWVIIFNREPMQWGAFNYNEKMDALRINVKVIQVLSSRERLKYSVNKDGITLSWEKLEVPVNIKSR